MELLGKVVDGLIGVMEGESADRGVGGTVRERCLVDVLAGCGELAFVESGELVEKWKERWRMLVNRSVELSSILLARYTLPFTNPALFHVFMRTRQCSISQYIDHNAWVHEISLGLIFLI